MGSNVRLPLWLGHWYLPCQILLLLLLIRLQLEVSHTKPLNIWHQNAIELQHKGWRGIAWSLKLQHTTCWLIHPEPQDLLIWCWAQIIYQRLCSQIIYAIKAAIGLGRSSESCLLTLCIQHAYESHSKAFETSAARRYLEAQGLVLKALDRANSGNLNEFPHIHTLGTGMG